MPLIDPVTTSAEVKSPASPPKPSLPVELLTSDASTVISFIYPAALLGISYLRFNALVESPTSTLLSFLVPLGFLQTLYTVGCLPAVGSNSKTLKKSKLNAPKKSNESLTTKAFTVVFSLLLTLFSIPLLAGVQVLFGAPITTHIPHTLLSSAHIALLAIFPLIYVHGSDGQKWREVASLYSPMDEVFGASLGCLLGAWIGAVPIPLDWDREWQKWPVTIVTGAYVGYLVGHMLCGRAFLKGKRIEFD